MIRLMVIAIVSVMASSVPAQADGDIEVTLSARLQAIEARIDRIERDREERFRKNQHYDVNPARSSRRFASTHYQNVAWANELLISDVADYGLRNLLSALVNESLNRAGIDRSGVIVRLHLDVLRVANHSVARINGSITYASGSISLVDAASGRVLRSSKVTANPIVHPTLDMGYQGPDFAFEDTDLNLRVGPVLSYFVMKGLEKLYLEADFPRPVALIYFR